MRERQRTKPLAAYLFALLCTGALLCGLAPSAWADEAAGASSAPIDVSVFDAQTGAANEDAAYTYSAADGLAHITASPAADTSVLRVDEGSVLPEAASSAQAAAESANGNTAESAQPEAAESADGSAAEASTDAVWAAESPAVASRAQAPSNNQADPAADVATDEGDETLAAPTADSAPETTPDADPLDLPSYYDSRLLGLISPVRLQDPWGACWAFGSLAAMEANLVKQGLIAQDSHLSARHLIYFAGTPVGQEAKTQAGEGQHPSDILVSLYRDNAVFEMGGHALEVASAISSGEGVVLEMAYPYQNDEGYVSSFGQSYSTDGTWSLDESARYRATYGLRNMLRFPNVGTHVATGEETTYALDYYALDAVKQAIVDYGAVSVSYRSYRNYDFYSHFDAVNATFFTNSSTLVDHDVCVVGWDDNFPREKFTTGLNGTLPEGNGAWVVKNSWGAASNSFPNYGTFGVDGYCYISFFDRSIQGFTAWDMMSLDGEEATKITNQYDYMGQRSNAETRVTDYTPTSYANVFTAQVNQAVRAVSVNTYAPNTEVSIQIYALSAPAGNGVVDPTDGILLASKQLTIDWGGYHRVALDAPALVNSGQRFAVVVSMVETDKGGNKTAVASIEAGNNAASMATYGLTHYDTVIVNPGETSVLVDHDEDSATPSIWMDGAEYAILVQSRARDAAYYGNANIKAFADPYGEPGPQPDPQPDPEPTPPAPSPEPRPAPSPVPAPAEQSANGELLQPPVPSVGAKAAAATPSTGDTAPLQVVFLFLISAAALITASKQRIGAAVCEK